MKHWRDRERRFSSFFSSISHLKNQFLWMKFQCWLPDFFRCFLLSLCSDRFAYVWHKPVFHFSSSRISFRFIFVLDLLRDEEVFLTSFQTSLTKKLQLFIEKFFLENKRVKKTFNSSKVLDNYSRVFLAKTLSRSKPKRTGHHSYFIHHNLYILHS